MQTELDGQASDAEVIGRSLDRPHLFATIFDRHFDAIHGYVRRRLGHSLAEEIASETFVRAFDGRSAFDRSRADARPWLLGIAANLMRRHWRTERRRLAAYDRLDLPAVEHAADDRADVVAALDALPAHEREALLLHALADLSYDELAEALGVPVGTVRSRLSRARDRIRKQLDTALPEGAL